MNIIVTGTPEEIKALLFSELTEINVEDLISHINPAQACTEPQPKKESLEGTYVKVTTKRHPCLEFGDTVQLISRNNQHRWLCHQKGHVCLILDDEFEPCKNPLDCNPYTQ